jgi:hypothetical protein
MKHTVLFSFLLSILFAAAALSVPTHALADDCAQITQAPSIYQATQTASSAALYFTPVNEQTTGYTINYGLSSGDDRYNVDFAYGDASGAINYTVGGLDPTMHYFFRVRAKNACSTGPYSDWFAATVAGATTIQGGAASGAASFTFTPTPPAPTGNVVTPVTGVSSAIMMSLLALGLSGVGGYLFFTNGNKKITF